MQVKVFGKNLLVLSFTVLFLESTCFLDEIVSYEN